MKLKVVHILVIFHFLLIFLLLKIFSTLSIGILIVAFIIDHLTNIKSGIKNLFYFLAAFSVFPQLFYIFLIYLPFAVFGLLLRKRSFILNYLIGFAISFIPTTIIYLILTYFSVRLNLILITIIFYLLPLVCFLLLKSKALDAFNFDDKDIILALAAVFFTGFIGMNILNDNNLFIANGSREFYRVQVAVKGLNNFGSIPIYDPNIGMGEATYLWVPPTYITHVALSNFLLGFIHPILFFNSISLFTLLLSTLSLGVLFYSILNKEKSSSNVLAVTAVSISVGLNFYSLQFLESFKQYYAYPIAYLLISMIIDNPKKLNEFFTIIYLSFLVLLIHSAYGVGIVILAASLFLITKLHYLKDRTEINGFLKWAFNNKAKVLIIVTTIILSPLFFISTPFIFKDFLVEHEVSFHNIKSDVSDFFKSYFHDEVKIISLHYPDVNRIDDHKIGFFLSIFGVGSFFLLMLLYKLNSIKNFRVYAWGYMLNLVVLSLSANSIGIRVGGSFRAAGPYLLILLGASILVAICLIKNKYIKLISILAVFLAFLHTVPYAKQNITNIHGESFMSGEISKEEINFIRQMPIDGRIMTYGVFNNVVDYGISYLTGRYGSRSERIELVISRTPHEKIHGQNSFGEPDMILTKSGTELSNYLILGGYKYLLINVCHPIGNYVIAHLYPNFTFPLYQNNCMVISLVNNTNYAEKIDLVRSVDDEKYKENDGYKFTTISKYYSSKHDNIDFVENPRKPESLRFERMTPTKINIYGNFNDNDWVVFKEQYFSRWRAYMDNKEIPVFATNNELILIKPVKGNTIVLEYSVLNIEKIFGVLSLIGFIGITVIFIVLLKKSYEDNLGN